MGPTGKILPIMGVEKLTADFCIFGIGKNMRQEGAKYASPVKKSNTKFSSLFKQSKKFALSWFKFKISILKERRKNESKKETKEKE
jgi:hypothetical protein